MSERVILYYTFGNHMHWVDMQWLWGYEVLPGSVADMLRLCRETGAKGNVNFDAVGYEKMAAEAPEALAALREAVARGIVEPVGCSYGQPYGQFNGGESNVRQLTFGVRATRRLLAFRPQTFWEEEFYFFPQLAQMLKGCGYTGACLFFQWTWHTPEVPKEAESLILWEGIDGTRLPALPRNELNLHQWPEDFDGLLESGQIHDRPAEHGPAAIVQWLELMPSRDWMCRSEVLLPRLKELMGDKRFEVRPRTAGELIVELSSAAEREKRVVPVRSYGPDNVWHGMTLGKNADAHPRASRDAERAILAAESISALAGLFGRPYASWDVYPTWELEEAWRNALAGQHHDNHECEGLCGFVGHDQFRIARWLAAETAGRAAWLLARRAGRPTRPTTLDDWLPATNNLGWSRLVVAEAAPSLKTPEARLVGPFGYSAAAGEPVRDLTRVEQVAGGMVLVCGTLKAEVDCEAGTIRQLWTERFPRGLLGDGAGLVGVRVVKDGRTYPDGLAVVRSSTSRGRPALRIEHPVAGRRIGVSLCKVLGLEAFEIVLHPAEAGDNADDLRPDAGLNAALQASFRPGWPFELVTDSPFAAHRVRGHPMGRRKYPSGDWMTSPQWFESIENPFTGATFVDLVQADGCGLLIAHDGAQQWFRDQDGVRVVVSAYDPWDEGWFEHDYEARFYLVSHGPISNARRVQLAAECIHNDWARIADVDLTAQPVGGGTAAGVQQDIPAAFGALEICGAPGVLAHAFYRESMKSGEHLPDWAGHRMAAESGGACTHPYVIRLVEWNGEAAEMTLKLPGPVALAAKTNLLGEVGPHVGGGEDTEWLNVEPADPPEWAVGARMKGEAIAWSQVGFRMRPREIATVMADLVMGRKEYRDLDARREVWATAHKGKQ